MFYLSSMNGKQIEALRAKVEDRILSPQCSGCGQNEWKVGVETFRFDDGVMASDQRALIFLCGYCGYVRAHSIEPLER